MSLFLPSEICPFEIVLWKSISTLANQGYEMCRSAMLQRHGMVTW